MQPSFPEVGLAVEITGLCAFVVPSNPGRPVRVLCVGADAQRNVPPHKPHLLLRIRDVAVPSAAPDHVFDLAATTYGLWSLDDTEMTIEGSGDAHARPRLLSDDSSSPVADGFWNSVPDHLVDIRRLVGAARISPRAAVRIAATVFLGGGDRALLAALPPSSGQPIQFQFDPPGNDPGYKPFLTDRVLYAVEAERVCLVLRTVRAGSRRQRDRIIVLREGGLARAYLQDASPSIVTHEHPASFAHFAAFYGLLEGAGATLTPPNLVAVLGDGVLSDTAFCPPALFTD